MSDLYFIYTGADGSKFIGYIQTLEVNTKGDLTITFGKETHIFIPRENDTYQCGECYRWYVNSLDSNKSRWFHE
jgi:hypothetical protein